MTILQQAIAALGITATPEIVAAFEVALQSIDRAIGIRAGDVLSLCAYMGAGSGGTPAQEVTGAFRLITRF